MSAEAVSTVDAIPEDIVQALRKPIARVRSHGGGTSVQYESQTRTLTIRLTGVCSACPALPVTFGAAFWDPLRQLDSVDEVNLENVRVSERVLLRIADSFRD